MPSTQTTISISGLTQLEAAELKAALASAGCDTAAVLQISPEPSAVGGPRKGDPLTMIAVVMVGQLALTGLALYLAKGRSRVRKKETLTIRTASGETVKHEVELEADREEAIKADLLGKVAAMKVQLPKS